MNAIKSVLNNIITGRFISMTGAKQFMEGSDSLSFSIPKSKGINKVKIAYNKGTDSFDVTFYNLNARKFSLDVKCEIVDVQIDNLKNVFESKTGLLTSL
jgi:hypothetical protein